MVVLLVQVDIGQTQGQDIAGHVRLFTLSRLDTSEHLVELQKVAGICNVIAAMGIAKIKYA